MRSVAAGGRWSTRHPWRAIGLWLAFVALAVAAVIATGTDSLQNGAVGESARGYALMDEHQAYTPAREYAYVHSDALLADTPPFRAAVADVAARLRQGVGGEVQTRTSPGRHSVLV